LPEQIDEASKFVDEIVSAEEFLPQELIQKLHQCPSDVKELYQLAQELCDYLAEYARFQSARLYVHLPVGSPAFMWILGYYFPHTYCVPVFSHTERIVEEIQQPDGTVVKKSVFKFEGFIFPDGGEADV